MKKTALYLLHASVFYACIEGLIINMTYPAKLPYIFKDFMIIGIYMMLLLDDAEAFASGSRTLGRVFAPILAFTAVIFLYMLMPGGTSFGALVAVKQRLLYIPLVLVGYRCCRDEQDVRRLSSAMLIYAIGVSIFGVYLYFAGPTALRGMGADYSAEFLTPADPDGVGGQYWRVPGTFNSPGQYGAYLLFNALVAVGLLTSPAIGKRMKIISTASLSAIVLAMLASGSRAPFILFTATLALLLVFSGKLGRVGAFGLTGYLGMAYAFSFLGAGVRDRFASIVSYEHVERFQSTYFGQMFLPGLMAHPLGSGLGVATIGARHFSEFREVDLVESYFGILAVETGVLAVITFTWLCLALIFLVWKLRAAVRGSPLHGLWSSLAVNVVFTVLILPVSTALDSAPMNFYFWLSLGIVARLADLQVYRVWVQQSQAATQAAARWPAVAQVMTRPPRYITHRGQT